MQRREQRREAQTIARVYMSLIMLTQLCEIVSHRSGDPISLLLCFAFMEEAFGVKPNNSKRFENLVLSEAKPLVNKINQLPDKLLEMVPVSVKEWGKGVGMCSTTAYVAYAIKNKRCSNLNIELDQTLNEQDGQELLKALKVNCPPGLKISYDPSKISKELAKEINQLTRYSSIKSARFACVVLQQGHENDAHILSAIPQEILEKIYTYIFPFPEERERQSHFGRYAGSRPLHVMVSNDKEAKRLLKAIYDYMPPHLYVDYASTYKKRSFEARIIDRRLNPDKNKIKSHWLLSAPKPDTQSGAENFLKNERRDDKVSLGLGNGKVV